MTQHWDIAVLTSKSSTEYFSRSDNEIAFAVGIIYFNFSSECVNLKYSITLLILSNL